MSDTIATLVGRLEGDGTGFYGMLATADRHLSSFEARARSTSRDAAAAFSGISISWRDMIGGLAFIGAGLSLRQLIGDAATFEQQINVIRAQSGATDAEMTRLEGTVRRLGIEYRIGATAAATAAQELLKSGVDIADVNNGALRSSVELARVLGDDYASAATIAATAMSVFGLSARDLPDVVQGIAGTVLAGRFELQDYALALQQGASAAHLAGLSVDDFNTLLVLFQRRIGGSGSDMGTLARTFLTRLVPASEEARARMRELGLEFFDAEGRFVGLDAAAKELRDTFADFSQQQRQEDFNLIFGVDALRAASALMDEGAEGVAHYREELEEQARVADVATARNQGLSGAVRELSAEWQELGITLMEAGLSDFLQDAVNWASALVRQLREAAQYLARIVPAIDTSDDVQSLTEQLDAQRRGLESARDRLSRLDAWHRANPGRDDENAMSEHYRAMIRQYEVNIADLEAALTEARRPQASATPRVDQDALRDAGVRDNEADRVRRDFLGDNTALGAEADAMREFEQEAARFQTSWDRYIASQERLLDLQDRLPALRDNIQAVRAQGTQEFLRALAQERGVLDELEAMRRYAPEQWEGIQRALNMGFDRIGENAGNATQELDIMRRTLESALAVWLAMKGRVESFERFDELSRSLETQTERIRQRRADMMLELETLTATGLFSDDDVERLRQRIQRQYIDALARTDGIDGATIRFAYHVNDTFRNAFINNDWDWSDIGDQIQRAWREALWDAFFGEDLNNYMRELALQLKRSISGIFGGKGEGSIFGDILGGIFGGGTGGNAPGGTGAGSAGIVEGEWDWMRRSGWFGDIWGAIRGGLGSIFGGWFADGGYLPPGQWGIAGEQGPEPIFGGKHGMSVVPAGEGGGGGTVINFNLPPNADAQSFVNSRAQIEAMLLRATARGQRTT